MAEKKVTEKDSILELGTFATIHAKKQEFHITTTKYNAYRLIFDNHDLFDSHVEIFYSIGDERAVNKTG